MDTKKNIYIMYAAALLQGMCFYGPIATLYRRAQGVSVFQITLIESIYLLLCLALEIPWGIIADRIGYKKTMFFCNGLYFISKIVFWQANGFWWFLLERVMLSIVTAGISGVDTSILYLSCEKGKSQRVFGVYNSLGMVGLLAASVIFSVFVGENYKLSGFLTVISYGLAALLSLFLAEVKKTEHQKVVMIEFKILLKRILKKKYLMLLLVAFAFFAETHQTLTVFLSQLQYEKSGMSASAIGYVFMLITLAGMCSICSDRMTKRVGMKRMGLFLYGMVIIACVGLAFAEKAIFTILGILTIRISHELFLPLQTELQNRQVQTENRATEISIYAMVIDVVSAGVSLIFGFLAGIDLGLAFFFGAGLCLAGAVLFFTWYEKAAGRTGQSIF